jgi:hypothetical protein
VTLLDATRRYSTLLDAALLERYTAIRYCCYYCRQTLN